MNSLVNLNCLFICIYKYLLNIYHVPGYRCHFDQKKQTCVLADHREILVFTIGWVSGYLDLKNYRAFCC